MIEQGSRSRIVCVVFIENDSLLAQNARLQLAHRNGYGWHHWRHYHRPSVASLARWRCIAAQKLAASEWGERQCDGYRIAGDAWLLEEEPKQRLTHTKTGWKVKKEARRETQEM